MESKRHDRNPSIWWDGQRLSSLNALGKQPDPLPGLATMRVPLNFTARQLQLCSETKRSVWPAETVWFSFKAEKISLWFWPRGWHAPPMLWPEGSQHQQISRWNTASHLTLKTEVPGGQWGGCALLDASATHLVAEGGTE